VQLQGLSPAVGPTDCLHSSFLFFSRVQSFASIYAAKLGCSAAVLKRALWGDYYYSPKLKKIVGRKLAGGKLKPMFVQLVLEPIWQVRGGVALPRAWFRERSSDGSALQLLPVRSP
jgi:hypothetical protein